MRRASDSSAPRVCLVAQKGRPALTLPPALGRPIIVEWPIGFCARAWLVLAVGLGLSFRGQPLLAAIIRIGSEPAVRCQSAGKSSYSKGVRLECLNCPFCCSSVAISTDLNCSEPNLVPAGSGSRVRKGVTAVKLSIVRSLGYRIEASTLSLDPKPLPLASILPASQSARSPCSYWEE